MDHTQIASRFAAFPQTGVTFADATSALQTFQRLLPKLEQRRAFPWQRARLKREGWIVREGIIANAYRLKER